MSIEIHTANYWENWKYYKELCQMNSPKRFEIAKEVEKIRLHLLSLNINIES